MEGVDKMSNKKETFRVNMIMSQQIVDFYQDLADEMGVPRSNAMIMALKTYMDQQAVIKMSDQFERLERLEKLADLEK